MISLQIDLVEVEQGIQRRKDILLSIEVRRERLHKLAANFPLSAEFRG